ncbi:hypothetical protein GRI44_05355 [Altererythrobacter confluentis]|uniref:Uncharacterized protein n=1 Tax=Allopontixanthobacter confluentis TaxID=1849021 RepID=A0A6L7GFW6_9SPHN|nr:hypothetical protein [Allopontixanthobacter confluentis]MXP14174.1 hypothetical protein [Allopontixanthobacter confluentis]
MSNRLLVVAFRKVIAYAVQWSLDGVDEPDFTRIEKRTAYFACVKDMVIEKK